MPTEDPTGDAYLRASEALLGFSQSLAADRSPEDFLHDFAEHCARLLDATEVALNLSPPGGDYRAGLLEGQDSGIGASAAGHRAVSLDQAVAGVAQALADVAAFAIAQGRAARQATELAGQLQEALGSRVVIEQAKGILAERLRTGMNEAFDLLRRYARNRSARLSHVAADVVGRRLSTDALVAGARPRRPRGRQSEPTASPAS